MNTNRGYNTAVRRYKWGRIVRAKLANAPGFLARILPKELSHDQLDFIYRVWPQWVTRTGVRRNHFTSLGPDPWAIDITDMRLGPFLMKIEDMGGDRVYRFSSSGKEMFFCSETVNAGVFSLLEATVGLLEDARRQRENE